MLKIPLPCVILSGGKSSRMGEDKSLLPFGDEPTLTQYQLKRLEKFFDSLHVSTKDSSKFDFHASFIEDEKRFKEHSPLVALYSILKRLQCDTFVLSVDTPFISPESIFKLYSAKKDEDEIVIAKDGERTHQLCGIYSPLILHKIEENLKVKKHKIRDLFENSKVKYVEFDNPDEFTNMNYKDDYIKAKQWLNT